MNKMRIYRNGQMKFWNLFDLVSVLKLNDKEASWNTVIEEAGEYGIAITIGGRQINKITREEYDRFYTEGMKATEKKVFITEKR